nr:retrovirus-related Pol polyprotein from transposon TNT 1-94 [Tanacetum cinerariifolium]
MVSPMVSWRLGPPPELLPEELSSLGVALDWVLAMLPLSCSAYKLEAVVAALTKLLSSSLKLFNVGNIYNEINLLTGLAVLTVTTAVENFCLAALIDFIPDFITTALGTMFLLGKGWVFHQTSVARTPEQNGVVERRNRTLVEAARTMLNAAKVPLFFWAEAIAIACFTQNRSVSRAYRVFNKKTRVIVETIHVNFDELPQMASDHVNSDPVLECQRMALEHDSLSPGIQSQENVTQVDKTVIMSNELDLVFSPMFDELLNGSSKVVSKSFAVTNADAPNQRQQQTTTPLNTLSTPDPTCQVPPHATSVTSNENMNQAEMVKEYAQVENDEFINIFCTPIQDQGETLSPHVDSSNMHTFNQHHPFENLSRTEPKNIKEAMADSTWNELMQEELYKFDRLEEEVYVNQPDSFVDPYHPDKVYRLKKALYGLKQAPRAWYDELSNFLIHQSSRGIFINQAKYAQEILIKHGMTLCDSVGTPMATKHLDSDLSGIPIDQTKYRSMVRALMYLTASRPDIMHATCYCARYQAKPTEKHLTTVKRIFRYLKDTIHMGLCTSGGIQFLGGDKLVSWSSKKHDCTSMSFAEAEYVSLSACCAQVLWMRTQLIDYGFHFDKIPMYCDSKAAIAISCNPVQHSRTKHIDVRYHFIKEKVEKGIVELFFVETEYQLADLFTKSLIEERF